jgi:F-type H+-transporting ATPase subunit b
MERAEQTVADECTCPRLRPVGGAACLLALALAVALTASGAARAADAADAKATEHASGDVDIFAPRLDLGLWTLVVFLVLFFLLRATAWKRIRAGLEKREGGIREAIEDARRSRDDAQRIRNEIEQELKKVPDKVIAIMDDARREGQRLTEDMTAKARTEIQGERDRLRREIETARDQALHELWNQTAQLATLVSAKAIRRELSPDDHRRLVDEALAELRQAGQEREQQVASVRT